MNIVGCALEMRRRHHRRIHPPQLPDDFVPRKPRMGLFHLVGHQQFAGVYHSILRDLADAYRRGDMEDAGKILDARQQMIALDEAAEQLAANGTGIPFF